MNLPDFLIDKYKDWKLIALKKTKQNNEKSAIEKQNRKQWLYLVVIQEFWKQKYLQVILVIISYIEI